MKRLLINSQEALLRAACMTDNKLTEIFIDNTNSMVGNIINGRVRNILPSRFAFIDIGQEKNAFMNISDGLVIKSGQNIPVQVRKDASGDKGANVSEVLQFKGRLAILYPSNENREIGVSQKITDKPERKRLQKLASKLLPAEYSCILRTQSSGVKEEDLQRDFDHLTDLYVRTIQAAKVSTAPKVLHIDDLILNELLTDDLDEIILDDMVLYLRVKNNAKVRLWEESTPLFESFNVERQITKALHRQVWLPCGGFITIDPVEACVVIDVNTGKFMGKNNYIETVLKTNLEAAIVIAEQIALRNLSGMIIVDFIDMPDEDNKKKLLTTLGQELAKGRIQADIKGMTPLGLVQLTRRKQREPLHRLLQKPCPNCNGTGNVKKV